MFKYRFHKDSYNNKLFNVLQLSASFPADYLFHRKDVKHVGISDFTTFFVKLNGVPPSLICANTYCTDKQIKINTLSFS